MNLNVFLLYYWHTQQTIQWCEAAIIKSHCLQNTILLNNASSLWPGVTADWPKWPAMLSSARVIIIIMIECKQTTASRPYNRECININWLNPSRSVIYIIQDQLRTTYISPTLCNNHIWFLVKQKEDLMHWQKTKYIFCSGKRNEIFCSFDCNLKLFFQCFRSASFSN